jgi:hypothetical protein
MEKKKIEIKGEKHLIFRGWWQTSSKMRDRERNRKERREAEREKIERDQKGENSRKSENT